MRTCCLPEMVPGTFLKVKVHAGADEDRLIGRAGNSFEVWVKAEAERGMANAAVLAAVAAHLGIEIKRLHIVKGSTSPSKIILIR